MAGPLTPVLGEQHLAVVRRHTLAAPEDGDAALGLDALQRPGIGGIGPQLHQGGIQHGAVVPQHFGKAIAVHDAAHLAAGGSAGGQYELSGGKRRPSPSLTVKTSAVRFTAVTACPVQTRMPGRSSA